MKIVQIKNPDASIYLMPWFVEGNQDIVQIGYQLNERMIESPETTYVAVAIDKGYIKAFIAAYIENEEVLIWQFKKSKDMNQPRQMEHKLYEWARPRGATKAVLGVADKRIRRLYRRKYGFTPRSGIYMEKPL